MLNMRMIPGCLWCLLISLLLVATSANAADPLGKTLLARGAVTADRGGSAKALKRLSPVFRQDVLRSGNNARAQFRMIDDAYINLQQNTVLRLESYQLKPGTQEGNVTMELISGGLRTITGVIGKKDKKDYQLKTPVATIGIRGTMYEVEIVPEGMYVAAWEGQVWIRSHSGRCDLTLGEGLAFRYALVSTAGECQTLRATPKIFREGHSSDSTENTDLAEVEIEPLLDNPRREQFSYAAVLLGLEDNFLVDGRADSINLGSALLTTGNGVLSPSVDGVTSFAANIGGLEVSWGRWNSYNLQPDTSGEGVPVGDENGLIWTAYQASAPEVVMNRQGAVRYENMLGSLSQSSMGDVTNLAVQMDVNFDSGAVTNGVISARVPDHLWAGIFGGQVSDGNLSLEFFGGNLVNSDTGAFTGTSGNVSGDFAGDSGEAVAGGFSMVDTGNTANQIEGVFLVGQ